MNNGKNSRNIYIYHRNPDTPYLLLFCGVVVSDDDSGVDSCIMIKRAKSFNSSLHNVSKKRLAEMQTGTFTPKRKKPIRSVSKKAASLWGKARNACLSRDGKRCVLCNATQNLHCHHFQFTRQQKPELKYDIDNLCILCYSCHNKAHNTKDSYNEYKKKIFAALHNKGIEIRNLERIPT